MVVTVADAGVVVEVDVMEAVVVVMLGGVGVTVGVWIDETR